MPIVPQRRFLKGLNAATPKFEQVSGSVPRLSNLLMTKRGGFVTVPGSTLITLDTGIVTPMEGLIVTEVALYQPITGSPIYVAVVKDPTTHLGAPVNLAAADGGAGGSLPTATQTYKVTALDGAGGETIASASAAFVNPGAHKVNLTWDALTNAHAYNVYRDDGSGYAFLLKVSTNAYTDAGSVTPEPLTLPPVADTTQVSRLVKLTTPTWSLTTDLLKLLPADMLVAPSEDPGGGGYGGSGGYVLPPLPSPSVTPSGGLVGNISPIPQLVQFNDKLIACLGNGYPPQVINSALSVADITNTFVAVYPAWAGSLAMPTNGIIHATASGVDTVFKAQTGGVTGSGTPTWNNADQLGQTIVDGTVIWVNAGPVTASPAPRGAAHGVVYAGALWLYNTYPTNTTDLLDGPCALRMSDINNPTSWNPLNTAFLGKDDGTQGTGLAVFTIAELGIAPIGSLFAFKDYTVFQIIGVFGSSSFTIQPVQTDMGCIAPRTIQFLPGYGIGRLAHLGVALLDGVRDRLISEEVRPFIFGGETDILPMDWDMAWFSKSAQSSVPPMYLLAIPVQPELLTIGWARAYHAGAGHLPAGNYAFRLYEMEGTRVVRATAVGGYASLGTDHILSISSIPTALSATNTWRVCYGIGGLTQYQTFTEAAVAAAGRGIDIDSPGTLGAPPGSGLTRILAYDLVLKAWTVVDLPWPIATIKQVRVAKGGTIPITVAVGFDDGALRRMFDSSTEWEDMPLGTDLPVEWSVRTPEVFGKSAADRLYVRQLYVRGKGTPEITATVTADSLVLPAMPMKVIVQEDGQFEAFLPVHIYGGNVHADLAGTGVVEIHSFDWDAELMPAAPAVMV